MVGVRGELGVVYCFVATRDRCCINRYLAGGENAMHG